MVVDRRCYSDGGLGFSPDGFRLRSRRCRNRGGSVVLEIGEQKHARDFEAAKEQCRMCKCNTVTRDDIPFAIWSGLHPDTPHQCVRAQCGFRFSSASSPTRSLTFGRWGCGERCHLSHVIGDSAVVLSGMSRQIALQTLSEALRRTKRVLNAHQGMEGAKNAYRGF